MAEKYSPTTMAADRLEWRAWLEENHDSLENVWLIMYHKRVETESIGWSEAVDEALCFGWIDSVRQKRDHESFYQFFARRNPKSRWSRINKEKVAKLQKEGRMMPAGLAMVEEARERGTWDALNDVENLVEPEDLQAAFLDSPAARKHWENFPPSSKRLILEWIHSARQEATRTKRIRETVEQAAKNIRANHFRQPKGGST